MDSLAVYVSKHSDRGECNCGKCFDRGNKPDPTGHVADMMFFKVAAKDSPDKSEFLRLTIEHDGLFAECNPLDGVEHGYIELGGWIGSQELALRYMALGSLLGVFKLLTPRTMLGNLINNDMAMQMAGSGYITVQTNGENS